MATFVSQIKQPTVDLSISINSETEDSNGSFGENNDKIMILRPLAIKHERKLAAKVEK